MQKTTLKTAALGETGMEITRVGFGAWAIGGGAGSSAGGRKTTRSRLCR
jgi:aryl-alcohol dehydrogenase-like predicted oxidoreductase